MGGWKKLLNESGTRGIEGRTHALDVHDNRAHRQAVLIVPVVPAGRLQRRVAVGLSGVA